MELVDLSFKGKNFKGYSRSRDATGIKVGDINFVFDAGVFFNQEIPYIFLSHVHSDHVKELCHIINNNKQICNVYLPAKSVNFLQNWILTYFQMTFHTSLAKINKLKTIPMIIGNPVYIEKGHIKYKITPYENMHSVPCLSYGIEEVRYCLNDEYKNLSQKELDTLAANGTNIKTEKIVPTYLYAADLSDKTLKSLPFDKNFNFIIIECTFYLEEHVKEARDRQHLHWFDIKPYVIEHPSSNFILIHFSNRYTKQDLLNFSSEIDKEFNNVKLFI